MRFLSAADGLKRTDFEAAVYAAADTAEAAEMLAATS